MIPLRTTAEIDAIAAAGHVLGQLFKAIVPEVRPGTTTARLDEFGESFIRAHAGAVPSFKGLYGFPASLCTSINEEIVHGIPSPKRVLREGDIVSIDAGVRLDGWCADSAITVPVGEPDAEVQKLLGVTERALQAGIRNATPGKRIGDIGAAVQGIAEAGGYSVVRELVGHGVGRDPHEEPQVPNFGRPGSGIRLMPGLVLAIEPMVNRGGPAIRTLRDRWTVVTADGKHSAHFEHTVAVTEAGPRILTLDFGGKTTTGEGEGGTR